MRLMILLSILAGITASTASAQECAADDESQTGMNICANADYQAADTKLNQTYGQIMKRLSDDADGRKRLQAAQRAWIAFRDADCAFSASGAEGGSIYSMIMAGCLEGLTETRAEQLGLYLQCEEGDMSCPVPLE